MKPALLTSWAVLLWTAAAVKVNHGNLRPRRYDDDNVWLPEVPSYNFTMPVDHFDSSNKHTFANRYFVNDTYYQPGGPVILYDIGESGVSPDIAAEAFAEFNSSISAPIQLAKKLRGLVIGWEHRYYGYSQPVEMDQTTGSPVAGAAGYQYLTVEQAMEDVAYFANRFNTTKLDQNDLVQSTEGLDPYNTPWIFIGGSYPGNRAAWARMMYPEIFYASWSSSAPLQSQEDGSIYFNPPTRSLPQNCTNDVKAAIKYVDATLESGSDTAYQQIQTGVYLALYPKASINRLGPAFQLSPLEIGSLLTYALSFNSAFQSFGPFHTTRIMCDYMESFNVQSFMDGISQSRTIQEQNEVLFGTEANVEPTASGIAAAYGKDKGGPLAFAALVSAMYNAKGALGQWAESLPPSSPFTEEVDAKSWAWQSATELGYFQGSNPQSDDGVVSKFYNYSAAHYLLLQEFSGFSTSSFPDKIANTRLQKMGGWSMKASNVMFTNGQFDPWRAFSVASEEKGAPSRKISQTVPKCNQPPPGTDVFGILYNGAVHAEDLGTSPFSRGSSEKVTPLEQGLALFLKAWDEWKPCFSTSRDDVRNGKGVDGQGNGPDGGKSNKVNSNEDDGGSAATAVGISVIGTVSLAFAAAMFSML